MTYQEFIKGLEETLYQCRATLVECQAAKWHNRQVDILERNKLGYGLCNFWECAADYDDNIRKVYNYFELNSPYAKSGVELGDIIYEENVKRKVRNPDGSAVALYYIGGVRMRENPTLGLRIRIKFLEVLIRELKKELK